MDRRNILLTGEGPDDYGWKDFQTGEWTEGAAAKLIRKCAMENGFEVTFEFADRKDVSNIKLQGRNLKGLSGKAIPARKFYMYLREQKMECGVFYCDADRDAGSRNDENTARKRYQQVHDEIWEGGNPSTDTVSVIPMVALRMVEAWLLSDSAAYEAVYGEDAVKKAKLKLPQHPELLWGKKDDPDSDYPKNVMKKVCHLLEQFSREKFGRQIYIGLAENSNIDEIARKCPISFQNFREELKYLSV